MLLKKLSDNYKIAKFIKLHKERRFDEALDNLKKVSSLDEQIMQLTFALIVEGIRNNGQVIIENCYDLNEYELKKELLKNSREKAVIYMDQKTQIVRDYGDLFYKFADKSHVYMQYLKSIKQF